MANKKKAKKKPLAKGKATSSPLTKAQVKGFEETDEANKTLKVAICIFLMVATFGIYSQVQDHEFVSFDDPMYTQNPNVKASFTSESVKWAFTTMDSEDWSPVNWLSHMLDYQLYGMHPKGHHLTNLFFHIANALLLFMVLHRMTGALWQSGFVAAMFAFHPLNVESVAWLAERKNVLSTFFGLLTIYAYTGYAAKKTIRRYSLVFVFFALGLMSKAMLVTLPFVLLLLDYWPLERLKFGKESDCSKTVDINKTDGQQILQLVCEKIPLFLLSVVFSIISFIAAIKSLQDFSAPLKERIIHSLITYLAYLQKMFWPSKLSYFYPYPENALSVTQGIFCGMVLVGITFISIKLIRKAPYFAVGWFWYLGTLVPVIGIFVQASWAAMADRYAYIPLIGIFIIIAWGFPELIMNWRYKKKALVTLAVIVIPLAIMTTWVQVSYWKNDIILYKHAIGVAEKKYPGLARTHYNLGIALFTERKIEEAITHYKMAIKLKPDHAKAHNNLGNALSAERKIEEAITHYKMAIKLKPDYAKAHNNLGNALSAERKIEEAIYHYKTAIKLKPNFVPGHNNLGLALFANRKTEEAISHFKMVIELKPDFAAAHYHLGNTLVAMHETDEAISYYKMAIKLNPDHFSAHNNLGHALVQKGEMKEAVDHYRETVRLRPDLVAARENLEFALLRLEELE